MPKTNSDTPRTPGRASPDLASDMRLSDEDSDDNAPPPTPPAAAAPSASPAKKRSRAKDLFGSDEEEDTSVVAATKRGEKETPAADGANKTDRRKHSDGRSSSSSGSRSHSQSSRHSSSSRHGSSRHHSRRRSRDASSDASSSAAAPPAAADEAAISGDSSPENAAEAAADVPPATKKHAPSLTDLLSPDDLRSLQAQMPHERKSRRTNDGAVDRIKKDLMEKKGRYKPSAPRPAAGKPRPLMAPPVQPPPPTAADFAAAPTPSAHDPSYAAVAAFSPPGGDLSISGLRLVISVAGENSRMSTLTRYLVLEGGRPLSALITQLDPTGVLIQRVAHTELVRRWGRDKASATARYKQGGLLERMSADYTMHFPGREGSSDPEVPYDLAIYRPSLIRLTSWDRAGSRSQYDLVAYLQLHGVFNRWEYGDELQSIRRSEQLVAEADFHSGETTAFFAFAAWVRGHGGEEDAWIDLVVASYQKERGRYEEANRMSRDAALSDQDRVPEHSGVDLRHRMQRGRPGPGYGHGRGRGYGPHGPPTHVF
jgi:hypothetical protein